MKPDIEPMLMIEPRPAASMGLPNARQLQKTPLRLTSSTFSQCSSATSSAGVSDRAMPALQLRMSTRPFSAITPRRGGVDLLGVSDLHLDGLAGVALGFHRRLRALGQLEIAVGDIDMSAGLGKRQAVERREVESATLLSRAEAKLEAATRQAAELTTRAKADAQRMLTEIRRSVNAEWDRLKREDKTRESLEQSRKRLVETARGVEGVVENFDPGGRAAAAGDRVEVPHLGLKGDVLTVDGGDGNGAGGRSDGQGARSGFAGGGARGHE